jgi:hypothetical protein
VPGVGGLGSGLDVSLEPFRSSGIPAAGVEVLETETTSVVLTLTGAGRCWEWQPHAQEVAIEMAMRKRMLFLQNIIGGSTSP